MPAAPRLPLPRFLQVGRAETVRLPLFDRGAPVAVGGGTFALLDSVGDEVLSDAVVVVVDGVPELELPSSFATGYDLPIRTWRERWTLTGVAVEPADLVVEHEVIVCRVAPTQRTTVEDLYTLHADWRRLLPAARPDNVDEPVDLAWSTLIRRLLSDGHLPGRILNWWRLATIHRDLAAAIVCRDFATDARGDSRWSELAAHYEAAAWTDYAAYLVVRLDVDDDGVDDGVESTAHLPYWVA